MRIFASKFLRAYIVLGVILGVIAIILFALPYIFIARANVYHLYASACLGGWENTHLAAGAPEALEMGGTPNL